MKNIIALFGAATFITSLIPAILFADTPKFSEKELHEKMALASTPAEQHKKLQSLVGTWAYSSNWWMKAGDKPETGKGTSTIESVLGGRFVQEKLSGTAMDQTYEGIGMRGFDTTQKKFTSVWTDNMSTAIVSGTGKLDKEDTVIGEVGLVSCPTTLDVTKRFRSLLTLPINGVFKYEMFMPDENGNKFRVLEVNYAKK